MIMSDPAQDQPQSTNTTTNVPGADDVTLQSQSSSSTQVVDSSSLDESRPAASATTLLTQAMAQPAAPAEPISVPFGSKEQSPIQLRELSVDLPPGVQQVEVEKSVEISPEVEKFIEEIKQHEQQIPQEVVINAQQQTTPLPTNFVSKPVVVLPLTEQELAEAKKESLDSSRRWLAEWTEKVMKMFSGSFIFKDTP